MLVVIGRWQWTARIIRGGGEGAKALRCCITDALQRGQQCNWQGRQQTARKQRQAARWALRRHLLLRRCFHVQSLWSLLRLVLLLSE